jgi:hypothetical protein
MMARIAPPADATCWMLSHPAVRLPRSCWYPRMQPPPEPSGSAFHIHTAHRLHLLPRKPSGHCELLLVYIVLASRCPCSPHTLHSPLKIPLGLIPPSYGRCRFPVGSVFIVAACSFCISFNTFCCSSDGMLYVTAGADTLCAAPHLKLLANL